MESRAERREAIRKYKEIKPAVGAFVIRCTATGRVWVGTSRNLDATRNGSWFSLRNQSHKNKSLQAEWDAHGEAAFQYEILERFKDDLHPLEVNDRLKASGSRWLAELQADAVFG